VLARSRTWPRPPTTPCSAPTPTSSGSASSSARRSSAGSSEPLGDDAARLVDALTLALTGALLQTGMGLISYDELAGRLDAVMATILREHMTTTQQPVALDPYDYAFQEDPYPVYACCASTSRCTTTRPSTSGR
jgi:hypothetical protein